MGIEAEPGLFSDELLEQREEYEVTPVPKDYVEADNVVAAINEHLAKAVLVSNGRWSLEALVHYAKEGQVQLFAVIDKKKTSIVGMACATVIQYPCARYTMVQFCGGQGLWKGRRPLHRALCEFARANKCMDDRGRLLLELAGRTAWLRVLEPLGYEMEGVLMRYALTDTPVH